MGLFLELGWQKDAACAGLDTEMFYTPESDAPGAQVEHLETIKRMCAGCPALADCYEHSINYEQFGVWAGLTANQRAQLRKEKNVCVNRPELQVA